MIAEDYETKKLASANAGVIGEYILSGVERRELLYLISRLLGIRERIQMNKDTRAAVVLVQEQDDHSSKAIYIVVEWHVKAYLNAGSIRYCRMYFSIRRQ